MHTEKGSLILTNIKFTKKKSFALEEIFSCVDWWEKLSHGKLQAGILIFYSIITPWAFLIRGSEASTAGGKAGRGSTLNCVSEARTEDIALYVFDFISVFQTNMILYRCLAFI